MNTVMGLDQKDDFREVCFLNGFFFGIMPGVCDHIVRGQIRERTLWWVNGRVTGRWI